MLRWIGKQWCTHACTLYHLADSNLISDKDLLYYDDESFIDLFDLRRYCLFLSQFHQDFCRLAMSRPWQTWIEFLQFAGAKVIIQPRLVAVERLVRDNHGNGCFTVQPHSIKTSRQWQICSECSPMQQEHSIETYRSGMSRQWQSCKECFGAQLPSIETCQHDVMSRQWQTCMICSVMHGHFKARPIVLRYLGSKNRHVLAGCLHLLSSFNGDVRVDVESVSRDNHSSSSVLWNIILQEPRFNR